MLVRGRDKAARQAFFGQCVFGLFRDLGATFIKVGQIMSTRPDLLPPHIIDALKRLQDDVGPFPFKFVRETIESDFGQPVEKLFAELSPRPTAWPVAPHRICAPARASAPKATTAACRRAVSGAMASIWRI